MCICRIAEYTRIMAVARDANMLQPGADTVHTQTHINIPDDTHTHIPARVYAYADARKCVRASVSLCVSEKKLNAHKAKLNADRKQSQQALHLLSPHHQLNYPRARARARARSLSLSLSRTHKRAHTHTHITQIEKLLAAEARNSPDMTALQARLGFPIRRPQVTNLIIS
jgi:hypothetical protein